MGKLKQYWNSGKKAVSHALFGKMALTVPDVDKFVGRTVMAQKEFDAPFEEVVIQDVRGCVGLGQMNEADRMRLMQTYQINGTHYCSILDFLCQLEENRRPTPEEIEDLRLMTEDVKIREITKGKK